MPTSLNENPKDYRLGWIGTVGIFVIPVIVAMVQCLHDADARHSPSGGRLIFLIGSARHDPYAKRSAPSWVKVT